MKSNTNSPTNSPYRTVDWVAHTFKELCKQKDSWYTAWFIRELYFSKAVNANLRWLLTEELNVLSYQFRLGDDGKFYFVPSEPNLDLELGNKILQMANDYLIEQELLDV